MAKDKHETTPAAPTGQPPDTLEPVVVAAVGDPRPPTAVSVSFSRREPSDPDQEVLWAAIRQHTEQIGFNHFADFVDKALCERPAAGPVARREEAIAPDTDAARRLFYEPCGESRMGFVPGTDLYAVLKLAAEIFLLLRCGVCPPPSRGVPRGPAAESGDIFKVGDGPLPPDENLTKELSRFLGEDRGSYIRAIVRNVFRDQGINASPFCPVSIGFGPCLMELIWSYWHEEAMLVQTTNAIALRFQNVSPRLRDPLADFELDALRPLSGFMWGYIQDESNRLSVPRRAYEYQHHYGLTLAGAATARLRPADSRSRFLQAFHDLLRMTDQFYREASDNTVTPDAFPLLIALRDLHLVLAEGAHNQFRDLPWTARAEMLVQQWLLSRTETRDFLRGRQMVPYPEPWMGAVDAMKRLQGWSDTNVIHFSDLARFGERLLLSVRHVRWDVVSSPQAAHDWAMAWRPEAQGYIHAYRMVTGVALADEVVDVSHPRAPRYLQPSELLRTRLIEQRRQLALPAGGNGTLQQAPRRRTLSRQP